MLSKIDDLSFVNSKNAYYLLLAMHIAGAIGLFIPETRSLFQYLTPFNLLATAAILLHFEKEKNRNYFLFIGLTFLIGFFIEVAGVKTGVIFGEYTYGRTLGLKFLEVPLAIGLNWVVMVYASGTWARNVTRNKFYAPILGALLMTFIDYFIEPVAVQLDFWDWANGTIPIRNYIGWFILSLLLQVLFQKLMPKANNSLAIRLLYILIVFFVVLNFI